MSAGREQWQHLYGSRWRKARLRFLTENPLCVYCKQLGHVTQATEVDHIIPHKGDPEKFWDYQNNWQSLCASHHRATKQKEERAGRAIGCDADGNPNDPGTHW